MRRPIDCRLLDIGFHTGIAPPHLTRRHCQQRFPRRNHVRLKDSLQSTDFGDTPPASVVDECRAAPVLGVKNFTPERFSSGKNAILAPEAAALCVAGGVVITADLWRDDEFCPAQVLTQFPSISARRDRYPTFRH